MAKDDDEFLGLGIDVPHDHDVLSGRGNFVNYHPGNEHFRSLVRKYKVAYVACPKPQKGHFSKMIYNEIMSRSPPGRFLKQNPSTKQWHDIGEKKALDKTRQALREGAPEIQKELTSDEIAGDFRGSSTDVCAGNDMRDASPQLSNGAHTVPMNCLTQAHVAMPYHENSGATFNPFPSQHPNFMMVPSNSAAHLQQAQSMGHHTTDPQRAYFPPQVLQSMYQQQDPSQSRISYQQQQQQQQQQQRSRQHSSNPVYQANPLRESVQVPSSFHNTLNNTAGDNARHDKFVPAGRFSLQSDPSHSDMRCGQQLGRPEPPSRSTSAEECEHIAPLLSEVNMFSFGRSRRDMQDLHFNSISSLGVDNVFHPDKQSSKSKQNSTGNQSFQMSLSEDGFQQSELDPNFLSGAFNSSLKIGSQSASSPIKSTSTKVDKIGLHNSSMEMSMNTIGEFGDSSIIKMTDSQADMSFVNVFDESNVTSRE